MLDQLRVASEMQGASATYASAEPFQHVVLDDWFDPEALRQVIGDFQTVRHNTAYDQPTSRGKFTCDDWTLFPPATLALISFMNSGTFLKVLADITSIGELTSDPYLLGGGLHETLPGGFLKMHTDFNFNNKLKLDRRINAILFLNEGWQASWGGELVLADPALKTSIKVAPVFNRLVIFNTNDYSFHGQPDPHTFPEGNSRKSVAMYYYSNGRPDSEISSRKVGTTYKSRHGGDLPLLERLKEAGRLLMGSKNAR